MKRFKKRKGVPVGYKEDWTYKGHWKERKIGRMPDGRSLWQVRFKATKHRKADSYGSFGKGTTGLWGFKNVKQRIIKTGKGTYNTVLTAIKYPLYFKVRKNRKVY